MTFRKYNFDLTAEAHFTSVLYTANASDFLPSIKPIVSQYLSKVREERPQLDKLFPVYMSENMIYDDRMFDFSSYVAQTCWDLLDQEGYDMDNLKTHVQSIWAQEHHIRSGNNEHIHGFNAQMTGFFILDAPEDKCSMVAFHDPRPAKKQINLPVKENSKVSSAHTTAYFKPEPGNIYFAPSWLPHEFTRHGNEYPITFIHFNVVVHNANVNFKNDEKENNIPSPTLPRQVEVEVI